MVFWEVIFPILALVAVGYGLGRRGHLEGEGLSKLTFWVLSPVLLFTALIHNEVEPALFVRLGGFVLVFSLVFWLLALALARLLRLSPDTGAALALALVFVNAGNYGLPFMLFAFGEEGFALGVVYISVSAFLMSTLGVVIATWGRTWSWEPFRNVLKTPMFYGVALALAFKGGGWQVPGFLMRPADLLAEATVPMLLILLGVQLVGVQLGRRWRLIGLATVLRLGLGPLVGWLLSGAFDLEGLLRGVAVLDSGMPTAVNALVLASYYGRDPRLVSSVVLTTTVASALSLTLLLLLLRG